MDGAVGGISVLASLAVGVPARAQSVNIDRKYGQAYGPVGYGGVASFADS